MFKEKLKGRPFQINSLGSLVSGSLTQSQEASKINKLKWVTCVVDTAQVKKEC